MKRKGAQIVGSMVLLIKDPKDIQPYLPLLLPQLKLTLVDRGGKDAMAPCSVLRDDLSSGHAFRCARLCTSRFPLCPSLSLGRS